MSNEALLGQFNELVDAYSQHRKYIDKARSQGEKFSSGVIEKVILDHEIKSGEVADQIIPLVPKIEGAIGEIDSEKSTIAQESKAAGEKMEELELRLAIGELDEPEFGMEGKDLKGSLDKAKSRMGKLDGDREVLDSALSTWVELAGKAGQDSGSIGIPAAVTHSSEVDEPAAALVDEGDELPGFEDVSFEGGVAESTPAPEPPAPAPDVEAVASGDSDFEDFSFSDEEAPPSIQLNVVDGGDQGAFAETSEGGEADEDPGFDMEPKVDGASSDAGAPQDNGEDGDRHALLLYQEGTTEEQVYPFAAEVLTIGRGRDNDIQIKDDSKVSRFHCKLFRRATDYFIEDNKSSNGTLVDGELITECRLSGGEEIIIGETFFRFRMM
jgi:hypothetical protein